jgi:hypothetical protein
VPDSGSVGAPPSGASITIGLAPARRTGQTLKLKKIPPPQYDIIVGISPLNNRHNLEQHGMSARYRSKRTNTRDVNAVAILHRVF